MRAANSWGCAWIAQRARLGQLAGMGPVLLPLLGHTPSAGATLTGASTARSIGRAQARADCRPRPRAPPRAAGEWRPGAEGIVLPSAGRAFVADTVHAEGAVRLDRGATIWFGTTILGSDAKVRVGAFSNVQDNTVATLRGGGALQIGQAATIGHNALL